MAREMKMSGIQYGGELYIKEADCRRAVNDAMTRARRAASVRDDAHLQMYQALEATLDPLKDAQAHEALRIVRAALAVALSDEQKDSD